jgi:GNAT superfamily N-acetyltransferase
MITTRKIPRNTTKKGGRTIRGNDLRIRVEAADPLGDEAAGLLRQMRAEALLRYGDVLDASVPATNQPLAARGAFFIAQVEGKAVACAALHPMGAEVAEVKRMYVIPEARRRGVARRLLAELEARAAMLGFTALRLETGNRQPEAIALYESSGFRRIAPYGSHVDYPLSICFEKALAVAPNHPAGGDAGTARRSHLEGQ